MGKVVGEAALGGFGEGCGVVGDQAAEEVIGMLGIAEVPGTVERMETGHSDGWGVADVVEPRGGGDQVSVFAQETGYGSSRGGDSLGVRPAAGEWVGEQVASRCLSVVCERHEVTVRPGFGTFTDAIMSSRDVLASGSESAA